MFNKLKKVDQGDSLLLWTDKQGAVSGKSLETPSAMKKRHFNTPAAARAPRMRTVQSGPKRK